MKELGEYLRKAREEKKISLQDIQNQTKIRTCYLEAIEKGDFTTIPGEVYVKGFLTNYAYAVGLDGKDVLERYYQLKNERVSVAASAENPVQDECPAAKKEELLAELVAYGKKLVERVKEIQLTPRTFQYIIAGGIGFGILLGIIFVISSNRGNVVTEVPAAVVVSENSPEPEANSGETSTTGVADLRIKATELVWISLKERDTGRILEEVNLQPGEVREWNIERPLVFLIGNAGGLLISLRGGEFTLLGKSGEVVSVSYEPNP